MMSTCSEFWFSDGNVVLKTGSTLFKVHRGQLTRHSEVFEGLFTVPIPDEEEHFEGCPVVELHDSPSDMFYFLRALYDGLYFKHPPTDDFLTISAVLRLSTKYFVPHLCERCLLRLEKDWPATLTGWDKRELEATNEAGHYAPREFCAHPVLLIELAYELNLEQFLPAAFYDLSRYGPSKIACGTMPPIPEYPAPKEDQRKTPTYLSTELLTQTFQGREYCQAFMAKFINSISHRTPSEDCLYAHNEQPSRPCIESFYFIALNLLRSVGGVACGRDADPLYTLVQAMDMLSRTDFSDGNSRDQSNPSRCALRMCAICKSEFAETCVDARNLLWKLLPVWFGLADGVDEEDELMGEADI